MLVNQWKHMFSVSPTSLSFPELGTAQPQLVSPFVPIISTEVECSFSLFSLVVSPPRTTISVLLSFSSGQTSCSAQTTVSLASPSQVPMPGSFSRVLDFFPPPQVLEHMVHGAHSAHEQPFRITSPVISGLNQTKSDVSKNYWPAFLQVFFKYSMPFLKLVITKVWDSIILCWASTASLNCLFSLPIARHLNKNRCTSNNNI